MAKVKHGHAPRGTPSPEYRSWYGMISRCTNPAQDSFKYYGARGIKVCERWFTFANFLADMGPRPLGLTLDRKDNSGDYEPDNCRWATLSEQRRNQRKATINPNIDQRAKMLKGWATRRANGWKPKRNERGQYS